VTPASVSGAPADSKEAAAKSVCIDFSYSFSPDLQEIQ
jgi:hypothetical protein